MALREDSKFPKVVYAVSVYEPRVKKFIDHSCSDKHSCWISCKDTDNEEAINALGWSNGYWSSDTKACIYFASTDKEEVKKIAKQLREVIKEYKSLTNSFGEDSNKELRSIYNAVRNRFWLEPLK
jgi:hypothetical protein